MKDLTGRVVLVTGAGKGGGRTLANAFAGRGAIVAANDISPVNVEKVVEEILENDGRARAYIEDVAKKVGAQNLIKQVEDDFGRIDILVNHASVEPHIPLLDMDEWDWHRTLDVNLTGAFLMTQSVGRIMKSQGSGVIINLLAPIQESAGDEAAFVTTMQGLIGFTQQAARELDPYGIQVHGIETGDKIGERVFMQLEKK